MTERSSLSILADLGTKLALPKIKESLKDITTGTKSDGFLNALANNLKARAGSWNAAATNIRQAIEALQIAEKALLEIAQLATRLEELGELYNNNSLLTTSDIASLDAETETITAAIDNIVSSTTYNGFSMLDTAEVTFEAGVSDAGDTQTLSTGSISSVASTTEATDADTTGAAVKNEVTLSLGEISGGITSLSARENIAYAYSAIMSVAASSMVETDLASETAILTKQMMLQKVSLSLIAQANLNENAKLNLLS